MGQSALPETPRQPIDGGEYAYVVLPEGADDLGKELAQSLHTEDLGGRFSTLFRELAGGRTSSLAVAVTYDGRISRIPNLTIGLFGNFTDRSLHEPESQILQDFAREIGPRFPIRASCYPEPAGQTHLGRSKPFYRDLLYGNSPTNVLYRDFAIVRSV